MSHDKAGDWVVQHGGRLARHWEPEVNLIVIGEQNATPRGVDDQIARLAAPVRQAISAGLVEVWTETEFWERLGHMEVDHDVRGLFTLPMLADLVGVSQPTLRSWQRRGLIASVRQVHRLAYYDFPEVNAARLLAALSEAGVKIDAMERQVRRLRHSYPSVARPLSDLPLVVEGKRLLVREDDRLVEPGGQRRFDFEEEGQAVLVDDSAPEFVPDDADPTQLIEWALELDERGELHEAAQMYRAALAALGADAEVNFALADVLYRIGDVGAARERYYMAVELNEDYVEARANLGCLLAEQGESLLAQAAFEGALRFHPDYPDAHYHLAELLDRLDRPADAHPHWEAFLALAPDSPWAEHARERLASHS
jgi:tetratricopeptide (TPR) repeat protein